MKLLFSGDWLRRKIDASTSEPEAGPSIGELANGPNDDTTTLKDAVKPAEVQMRMALGVVVRDLRLKEGLSIAELAARASVSEEELRLVEHDPYYTARPRLIYQLSKHFDFALAGLSQMSGATGEVDADLYDQVVKYAAYSDDKSALTDEQKRLLDAFVATVNARSKVLA